MSNGFHRRRSCGPCWSRDGRHRRGPVKRVVRALAERFDLPRGIVIAAFVLGLVFVPLLTVLLFLAAWYWTDHPARAERIAANARDALRGAASRVGEAAFGAASDGRAAGSSRAAAHEVAAVAERFAVLERRARAIERYVASEEYRLDREFRRMGGDET